jgi:hypothetical protein
LAFAALEENLLTTFPPRAHKMKTKKEREK